VPWKTLDSACNSSDEFSKLKNTFEKSLEPHSCLDGESSKEMRAPHSQECRKKRIRAFEIGDKYLPPTVRRAEAAKTGWKMADQQAISAVAAVKRSLSRLTLSRRDRCQSHFRNFDQVIRAFFAVLKKPNDLDFGLICPGTEKYDFHSHLSRVKSSSLRLDLIKPASIRAKVRIFLW
jgi:hypothetical protein